MVLVHQATRDQVENLTNVFARPVEINGELAWVLPEWLQVMLATVNPELRQAKPADTSDSELGQKANP